MKRLVVTLMMCTGLFLFGQGFYMEVKAEVAQVLIAASWHNRTPDSPPTRPWWWADTKVIAKLDVPRLKETVYVMQDDSGESLAFGPGHMPASARPSEQGHVVIAGHRDSHFEFLKNIQIGDLVLTKNNQSNEKKYRVKELIIIDVRDQEIPLFEHDQLTLITCYPFENFIPGGPLRLVVHAEPLQEDHNPLVAFNN